MTTRLFLAGACAVTITWGCASSEPDPESEGERTAVDIEAIVGGTKTAAYPSAALLNMRTAAGASYACTAVVIAPKVVLTAGHCVDGMVSWQVTANGSLRTSTKGETYDWKENGASTVNPLHHDLGLVYLTDPIVLASYPTLAVQAAPVGSAAVDVGRIRNGAVTNEIFSAPITLRSGLTLGFPFDYAATGVIEHGDSGGPVFLGTTQTLVAVNSGLGQAGEVLARVDLLADWLKARIAAQAAASPPSGTDAGASGTDASAPKPDAGAAPPSPACASPEVEPNNAFASASALKTTACGTLAADDLDWFTFAAPAGKTILTVASAFDASATFGFASAGKCVPVLQNVKSVSVSVLAGSSTVCIGVSSPSRKVQPYTVAAVR
jgi:V8-like Glu-specific endopeptidase